jgi:hypothetical protein
VTKHDKRNETPFSSVQLIQIINKFVNWGEYSADTRHAVHPAPDGRHEQRHVVVGRKASTATEQQVPSIERRTKRRRLEPRKPVDLHHRLVTRHQDNVPRYRKTITASQQSDSRKPRSLRRRTSENNSGTSTNTQLPSSKLRSKQFSTITSMN